MARYFRKSRRSRKGNKSRSKRNRQTAPQGLVSPGMEQFMQRAGLQRKPGAALNSQLTTGRLGRLKGEKPVSNAGSTSQNYGQAAPPATKETPPKPVPLKVEFFNNAPDPRNKSKTRKKIGVGELLQFSANKEVTWRASAGMIDSLGRQAVWEAPKEAGTYSITATAGNESQTLQFQVIAPSKVTAVKEGTPKIPSNVAGAGMYLRFHYGPNDVSFSRLGVKEGKCDPSIISGRFKEIPVEKLKHIPIEEFTEVGENNADRALDLAAIGPITPPYKNGTLQWRIPLRYRLYRGAGEGIKFAEIVQTFYTMQTGGALVVKGSAFHYRKPE